jgi:hypothetical protein
MKAHETTGTILMCLARKSTPEGIPCWRFFHSAEKLSAHNPAELILTVAIWFFWQSTDPTRY